MKKTLLFSAIGLILNASNPAIADSEIAKDENAKTQETNVATEKNDATKVDNNDNKQKDLSLIHALLNKASPEQIEELINQGANIEEKDANGFTPLIIAIKNDCSPELLTALLKGNPDVNAVDKIGRTAMIIAKTKGNKAAVEILNKNINAPDVDGMTNFMKMLQGPGLSSETVSKHLKGGADVKILDNFGRNALWYAIRAFQNNQIIKDLIEAGSDINIADKEGLTPLMLAASFDKNLIKRSNIQDDEIDLSNVQTLIEHKANIDAFDNKGMNALMYAIVTNPNPKIVKILCDAGAKIDVKNKEKLTTLMLALLNSNPKMVQAVIDAGADVNAIANEKSILFQALELNNNAAISMLAKAGVNVNQRNKHRVSALEYAISNGNTEGVIELVKNKANVNEPDENGITPLMLASVSYETYFENNNPKKPKVRYFLDIIDYLIGNGANIKYTRQNHQNILMYTVSKNNSAEVAEFLVNKGALLNETDEDGNIALMYAIMKKQPTVVAKLLEMGSIRTAENRYGITAKKLAKMMGNQDIEKILIQYKVK